VYIAFNPCMLKASDCQTNVLSHDLGRLGWLCVVFQLVPRVNCWEIVVLTEENNKVQKHR